MEEFKGTPGPWAGKDVGICKQDDVGLQLGFITTSDENRRDECAANAHLIAAAPELLEALQEMVAIVKKNSYPQPEKPSSNYARAEAAQTVIEKALGK